MRAMRMGIVVAAALAVAAPQAGAPAGAQDPPPETGFERTNGQDWTTHQEELAFLREVDERSERVAMEVIGTTAQGRPIHLVRVGHPAPRDAMGARSQPTTLYVCTQHGNEPAGREACLITLRDLAFTGDPGLVELISTQTFLFIPTANPDGREANSRGNSAGVDVNRDHLNLRTPEARAISAVVRDWAPDLSLDLHEYGPSVPVLYDDEVLYLWPRNLNVERQVHDHAQSFSQEHLAPCAEEGGYTADEYGLFAAGPVDVVQTAGNHDEGIMRNAMGLRHSLGILVETAVSPDPRNGTGDEVLEGAANRRRRVESHRHVIDCSLEYMAEQGETVMEATATAPLRKEGEGLAQNFPVYFGGADNDEPSPDEEVYPPPCAYDLTAQQAATVEEALELHGIEAVTLEDGTVRVPMGQAGEPVIPLLLDGRGDRRSVPGTPFFAPPLDARCGVPEEDGGGSTAAAAGAIPLLAGGAALVRARRRRLG